MDRRALIAAYRRTRGVTEALTAPLSAEDQQAQSMPACSPAKWHRAHTTWFFEQFVLAPRGARPHDPRWSELFNSYYEAVGPRHARAARGLLTRPDTREITAYRAEIDAAMLRLLEAGDDNVLALVPLGLAHEEQHQELILTDVLHLFGENPLFPAYRPPRPQPAGVSRPLTRSRFPGGLVSVGAGPDGFAFDNERPRHKVWLEPFALADRLLTVGEVQAFAAEGGYATPSLWLSEGWDLVRAQELRCPHHVHVVDGQWQVFGLEGLRPADPAEPAVFLSYYEADALARFFGARLPSEAEWELAARDRPAAGGLGDPSTSRLRPRPATGEPLDQLYGEAWQWTSSSYEAYPGFAPAAGAVGEYNGKFMVNQRVLRGGSCFTPAGHSRATYRNFWPAATRFQVTGVRLAWSE